MHSPLTAVLIFVGFVILVTGTYAWLIVAAKAALTWALVPESIASTTATLLHSLGFSPRLPLVPSTPRRPIPWTLIDLALVIGIGLGLSLAFVALNQRLGWLADSKNISDLSLTERQITVIEGAAIRMLIVLTGISMIALRTGARLADFGFSWLGFVDDIRLGLIGFVMVAPPVYALQGVLVSLWKESKHPIVEMFKAAPDATLFGLLVFSAVVAAPLFEELMFRVLLQGFLEKAFSFRGELQDLLIGPSAGIAVEPRALQPELHGPAAWLPIAISSTIFALLHYSHGPDWIPLLLLAAGMGYLYQRTHRILPSLIVHSLLNSLSMWGLWVAVKEGLGS